jgi:flagellar assembly protein FliH
MAPPTIIRARAATGIGRLEPEPLEVCLDPAERVHDQAFRAGYAEGQRLASEAAQAAAQQAAAEQQRRLGAGLALLENAALLVRSQLNEELDRLAKVACSLAMALTESILQRELELSSNPGAEAIARALALLPGVDAPAVARLNPADLELLGPLPGTTMSLVADPAVAPGGCVLDTGSTLVDARLETALQRVRAILEQAGGGRDD